MRVLALLVLLLAPAFGLPARQARLPQQPARVAGTKVSLVPPEGFAPAAQFTGYALEEAGASILISELPFALSHAEQPLTDPEKLKGKAMTLLSKEAVEVGGAPGLLLGLKQSASGAEYRKWVLLVGDGAETLMVTATFPAEAEGRLSAALRRSVLTARWVRAAQVPSGEGLPYTVGERGALKFAQRIGHTLLFSAGGVFPVPSPDAPLFVVAPSFGAAVSGDRRAFAEGRVLVTASVTEVAGLKTEPLTVDGLGGFETVADAKDKATGQPLLVYQAILFDGAQYYLMQGLTGRRHAPEHLPSFKEMARSFKRR